MLLRALRISIPLSSEGPPYKPLPAALPSEILTKICRVKRKSVECPTRGLTDMRVPQVLAIYTLDTTDLRGGRQDSHNCSFLDKKTELTSPAE